MFLHSLSPEALRQFAERQGLFLSGDLLVVAVSGGVDSMVLTDLLHRLGQPMILAHMHFGLRGEESEQDALWIAAKAAALGVDCRIRRVDTRAQAAVWQMSVQETARRLRYEWFEALRRDTESVAVVTAHHQDDNAETVLWHWTRGSGPSGLRGIPLRQGNIVRPLLCTDRSAIEAYATTHQLDWREDSSNAKDDYTRNYLRHQVLPALRHLNPRLSQAVARSTQLMAGAELLLQQSVQAAFARVCRQEGHHLWISTAALVQEVAPVFLLGEWLRGTGFGYEHAVQAWDMAQTHPPGHQLQTGTHRIVIDRNHLILSALEEDTAEVQWSDDTDYLRWTGGTLRRESLTSIQPPWPDGRHEIWVDADRLTAPLHLRPWQAGDWFCPFGLKGRRKKVSDLLTDLKVPLSHKAAVRVLCSGTDIVWVVGYRADQRFGCGPETQTAWRLVADFSDTTGL